MKKINKKHSLLILMLSLSLSYAANAGDPDDDMRDDENNEAVEFDWQDDWGSIHMNSFADGLADPGHSGGKDLSGVVPCAMGDICTNSAVIGGGSRKVNLPTFSANQLFNGIKYDIKNSVNNCMARPSPNFPSGNGGWENPFSTFVCDGSGNDIPAPDYDRRGPTIIYSPIWDVRSNDERANSSDGVAGCIQQISNSCINDIYECHEHPIPHDRDKGWDHPVSHVFLDEEIDQLRNNGGLSGNSLPRAIYRIQKATSVGSWQSSRPSGKYVQREISGATEYAPVSDSDIETVLATRDDLGMQVYEGGNKLRRRIPVKDDALMGIRSFTVNPGASITDPKAVNGFIVVDPSEFFDLRMYMAGGSKDVGYGQTHMYDDPDDPENNPKINGPKTFDTCPILGLNTGYGGICDPTGKAGCNLPIYGIGNTTSKTAAGKTWESTPTPIIWSGYVKSWKFITEGLYVRLTKDRRGPNGEELYLQDKTFDNPALNEDNVNGSLVLMVERHNSYCDNLEFFDENGNKTLNKCVQYFQYQQFMVPSEADPEVLEEKWSFFNLFAPEMRTPYNGRKGYATLKLYNDLIETVLDPDTGAEVTKPAAPYMYDKYDIYSPGMPISTTGGDGTSEEQMVPIWCQGTRNADCGGSQNFGNYVMTSAMSSGDRTLMESDIDAGGKRPVSFMDKNLENLIQEIKVNANGDVTITPSSESAVWYSNYTDPRKPGGEKPPRNADGKYVVGKDENGIGGYSIDLKPGTALALRFRHVEEEGEIEPADMDLGQQFSTNCVIISNKRKETTGKGYFVPTNSREEINAFMNAGSVPNTPAPESGMEREFELDNGATLVEKFRWNDPRMEASDPRKKKILSERNFFDKDGHEYLSFRACKAKFAERRHEDVLARNQISITPIRHPAGTPPSQRVNTWFGKTNCNQLAQQPACNQSQLISAKRVCILEDGKMGDCNDCINALNKAADDGKIISNPAYADGKDGVDDLSGLPSMFNEAIGGIVLASASQCYFSALCLSQDSDGCPSAETSGGHVFCLSGDTMIEMADGSQKAIADIKDGESVMAFSASGSKSELIQAKVVATTVTENERFHKLVTKDANGKISTVRITGEHKVILSNGRGVQVHDLREGITILDRNGNLLEVQSVEESDERIKVHNLILEDKADGYIAAGMRVQSYPLDSELKDKMEIK